jgi:S1-C subfamily serine protease
MPPSTLARRPLSKPPESGVRRGLLSAAAFFALLAPAFAHGAGLPLVALVAAARPGVLPIGTLRATDNPRFGFRGTAFVVGSGRFVVTNLHVLPDVLDTALAVQLPGDAAGPGWRSLTVRARDRAHDLALLEVEGEALPSPLPLADDALAGEGTDIVLLGYPIGGLLGYSTVTHRGIVASVTRIALPAPGARLLDPRTVAQLRQGAFEIYQLDANAYPGNSGGPVIDVASGRVVGVLNMVLARATREGALSNPTGISYAIPVRHVRALLGVVER